MPGDRRPPQTPHFCGRRGPGPARFRLPDTRLAAYLSRRVCIPARSRLPDGQLGRAARSWRGSNDGGCQNPLGTPSPLKGGNPCFHADLPCVIVYPPANTTIQFCQCMCPSRITCVAHESHVHWTTTKSLSDGTAMKAMVVGPINRGFRCGHQSVGESSVGDPHGF